ncbi:hypothetical protein ACO3TA_07635 [Methanocaldococcus sp. 28A]
MIRGVIAYIINKLKENGMYGRTYVQKITYFIFPELRKELYIPYLYGPYSPNIQRVIQYLEVNPKLVSIWEKEIESSNEYKSKIDKLIEFIKNENISVKEISLLAKINYILYTIKKDKGDEALSKEDIELMKLKSKILGWTELSSLNDNKIQSLIEKMKKIEEIIKNT